jgi:hypothetical protein
VGRRLLSLALLIAAVGLNAATLIQLSLDDMIVQSTSIVRGRVGTGYTAFSGGVIYTHYSVQVLEQLKGTGAGVVDVAVPGGALNGLQQTFSGAPELRPGSEYVLFLWTGKSGTTQVIGLTQGLFSVATGSPQDPVTTRTASRELMLAPKTGVAVKDQPLALRLSELRTRIAGVLGASRGVAQ